MPSRPTDQQLATLVRHIARKHLEIERGLRSPNHLKPFLTDAAYRQLRTPGRPHFPRGGPVIREDLGSVVLSHGAPGVVYATVPTRQQDDRWGAVNVELERGDDGRFKVSHLERVHRKPLQIDDPKFERPEPEQGVVARIRQAYFELRLVEAAERSEQRRLDEGLNDTNEKDRVQEQVDLWQRRATDLRAELSTLGDRIEIMRQVNSDGPEIPQYLAKLVGLEPDDRDRRELWLEAIDAVESYRHRWSIEDTTCALGPAPEDADQQAERASVIEILRTAERQLRSERTQEQARDLPGPLDLGPGR